VTHPLLDVSARLSRGLAAFTPGAPARWTYRPLEYAWPVWSAYVERYVREAPEVLFLGMNPGPHGMTQTGVPFGDPGMVRDFLGLSGAVGDATDPCPSLPVRGLASTRREGSGARVWGWVRDRFGSADAFAERFAILSWCPLCFLDEGGRNLVPERLVVSDRRALYPICDAALVETVRVLRPKRVVAFGGFAEARALACGLEPPVSKVLHPSPASPAANRGWAAQVDAALAALGVV
jgi:single-strand selective monofunctional uracil DNA glycosylase